MHDLSFCIWTSTGYVYCIRSLYNIVSVTLDGSTSFTNKIIMIAIIPGTIEKNMICLQVHAKYNKAKAKMDPITAPKVSIAL